MKISFKERALFWGRVKMTDGSLYVHGNPDNSIWFEYYHYFTFAWHPKWLATWGYEAVDFDGQRNHAYNFGRFAIQWA